ncbi:MAG TPA: helix-turn-helix domain-containing protein [Streptosporangiaceae bacterium]
MLTASQVCERLRISRETLRQLIQSGQITAIRVGPGPTAHVRISEDALAEYVERQTVKPAAS